MVLDEQSKEKNYEIFIKKLSEIGIDTAPFEQYKDALKNATYSTTNENGLAYDGSFLNVILRTFTPCALKINELLPEETRPKKEEVIKISLLFQFAKCKMYEKTDNEYELRRGVFYKYIPTNYALKCGMRSLLFAQELGVKFTELEAEAMTVLDQSTNDKQSVYFASPLSTVIRQANELTYLKSRMLKK